MGGCVSTAEPRIKFLLASSYFRPGAARCDPFWRLGGVGGRLRKANKTIRLIFDQPLRVQRLQFHFVEPERERMQEFTVAWVSAEGGEPKEIVRQQWNFSPAGSKSELEDYEVNLDNVASLELVIKPDLARNSAIPTLAAWRVA
jgi:hypothetical protein